MSTKDFNELERAVLDWFIEKYKDPNLTAQIRAAKLTKRTWTGVGFWIDMELSDKMAPLDASLYGQNANPIDGPGITSPQIEDDGDALLWHKEGYLDWLELYCFGQNFAQEVRDFHLYDIKKGN